MKYPACAFVEYLPEVHHHPAAIKIEDKTSVAIGVKYGEKIDLRTEHRGFCGEDLISYVVAEVSRAYNRYIRSLVHRINSFAAL